MDLQRLAAKKENLKRRAEIMRLTRRFFYDRGYLEVDTPALADCPIPEAFIEPISTERGFLLPSPELYMKPLLAARFGDIYQVGHVFRRGEQGQFHREEFTLLEYYRMGRDYLELAEETESLIAGLAVAIHGSASIHYQGMTIDLTPPWPKMAVKQAFIQAAGWDPVTVDDPERFDFQLATLVADLSRDKPLILYDFPAKMASLARLKAGDRSVAERTEIFIGGLELANIFSELTDLVEQRQRFESEVDLASKNGRAVSVPEEFLESLAQLPVSAGGALGVDRLVMLLCDASSIEDVVAFPV